MLSILLDHDKHNSTFYSARVQYYDQLKIGSKYDARPRCAHDAGIEIDSIHAFGCMLSACVIL